MRTICGSPIVPSATAWRTEAWAGSKRRLKPIWNGTPACSTAASAASISARSSEIGFSQKIALPARAAATIRPTWVSVLVQIATASTSAAASSCSLDAATVTSLPSALASACAAGAWRSKTAVTRAPATRRCSSSACIVPMRPAPSRPTRSSPALIGPPPRASSAAARAATPSRKARLARTSSIGPLPGAGSAPVIAVSCSSTAQPS